ncbi:hypothetical protein F5B19DRAFT_147111 [Rostrohypoxylon terebratum]|nr:hypothetical protein F5B19DRAFT_147111 [Rostrohypoxylon terebratum]
MSSISMLIFTGVIRSRERGGKTEREKKTRKNLIKLTTNTDIQSVPNHIHYTSHEASIHIPYTIYPRRPTAHLTTTQAKYTRNSSNRRREGRERERERETRGVKQEEERGKNLFIFSNIGLSLGARYILSPFDAILIYYYWCCCCCYYYCYYYTIPYLSNLSGNKTLSRSREKRYPI